MTKKILITFGLLIITPFAATAAGNNTIADDMVLTPYLGCYEKTKVEKILTDGEYLTLYRGKGPDGRVNETWINGKGLTVNISFKSPKNDDHSNIKEVCVTNVTKNTVYNSALLEVISKDTETGTKL